MGNKRSSEFNTRQYMLSRDYEIYYYSNLHFQSVGSHSHDYYEFYFFVEGDVVMEIDGDPYALRPGDVIVVPPGIVHRAILPDSGVPYRRFVFWISRDYMSGLVSQSDDYAFLIRKAEERSYLYHFDPLTFNSLRSALFSLLDELHADRFGRETQMNLDVCHLLLSLNRLVYDSTRKGQRENVDSKYEAITEYIDTHLDSDLSLDSLSREFYLSKYYIAHLFRDSVGLSVHQYISKKRLSACCDAIRSGSGISVAFMSCGFRDYTSFYRAFKKEYGMSPAEYRELYRETSE